MFNRHKARPLVWYLVAAVAALAVPLFVIVAIIAKRYVEAEQKGFEEFASHALEHIVASLDRDTAGRIAMLEALATSPSVKAKDYEAFDRQARELMKSRDMVIILCDAAGRQIVNTRYSWGANPPAQRNSSGSEKIVRETRRPYISNLFTGRTSGLSETSITVPVISDSEVTAFVTLSASPQHYTDLLAREGLTHPYFASIADRDGRILARSSLSGQFLGREVPGFESMTAQRGTWSGRNLEEFEVTRLYERVPDSGWIVSMGVEKSALQWPLLRSLQILAALLLVLLISGAALAWFISRIMTTSFQSLRMLAGQIESQGVITAPQTPIAEANVIGEAMAAASRTIIHQADELSKSKQDLERRVDDRTRELADKTALLEVTLENMDQGLFMVDRDGYIPVHNRRVLELLDLPKSLLARHPHFDDLIAHQEAAGEFIKTDAKLHDWIANDFMKAEPYRFERQRPSGTVLEVRTVPMRTGGMVRTFSDITEQHRATQRITHMAHHDALTGLANRVLFRKRLEQAFVASQQEGRPFSVLLIDLDRFKLVNDSLGHSAGDSLIKVVARRLAGFMTEHDTIARLGGDEFAMIRVVAQDHRQDAVALAEAVLESLQSHIHIDGREALTTASIGIVLAPGDGVDPENILKNADLALYRAKSDGRNTFRFFEADMDHQARERNALEIEFRHALSRNEFEVYYQPVINAAEQKTCGYEALVRWHHPQRGMISPVSFIPLAEETGGIVQLGEWVLRRACMDAASWPSDIKVAVNLSPVQLRSDGLVDMVASALAESGLPAHRLELEITETVLLQKDDTSLAILHAIKDMGVAVVLDDFGTGYSSLSYVRAFPFDKIKIDKSFVDEMETRPECAAIITAVTGLARMLNIDITAEGVETPEQFELLRAAGCGQAQGYLFSRPRPLHELRFDDASARDGYPVARRVAG